MRGVLVAGAIVGRCPSVHRFGRNKNDIPCRSVAECRQQYRSTSERLAHPVSSPVIRIEVRGPIESGSVELHLDNPPQARVRLAIATAELKVTAAGEPEGDAPKVQEAMSGEKVLDVAHHPRVIFESTEATLKSRRGTRLDLIVTGQLTIRAVSQRVSVPVGVEITDGSLTATGGLRSNSPRSASNRFLWQESSRSQERAQYRLLDCRDEMRGGLFDSHQASCVSW